MTLLLHAKVGSCLNVIDIFLQLFLFFAHFNCSCLFVSFRTFDQWFWLLSRVGSVPSFYREVYDIVCPNQEQIDHDMFLKLLVKTSLPSATLSQV